MKRDQLQRALSACVAAGALLTGCASSSSNSPPPANAASAQPRAAQASSAPPPSTAPPASKNVDPLATPSKVSHDAKADYEKALKAFDAAPKPLTPGDCKSLAKNFLGVASDHKEVATKAKFSAGAIYDSCGMSQDAQGIYQDVLRTDPNYGPALTNVGQSYMARGDNASAKQWFEKAIAADPTHNAAAYVNLAAINYGEAKKTDDKALYDKAVGGLSRALAIDNDNMPAYHLLALIKYTTAEGDLSRLKLAELVCKQATDENDKYAPIYNTLGLIKLKQRNVTAALQQFEKAVSLDPNFVEAHLNIGAIGLSSRQYDKAQTSFDAVLKLQPKNFDATIGKGVALRGQRKLDDAEVWYKKAGDLDPSSCTVPYDLGLLYQDYKVSPDNSNLKQAQQFYNKFVSCANARGADKVKVADAQRRVKDIDDTFVALEQAKKLADENTKMQEEMKKQMEEQQKQMQQQQQKAAPPTTPAPGGAAPAPKSPSSDATPPATTGTTAATGEDDAEVTPAVAPAAETNAPPAGEPKK